MEPSHFPLDVTVTEARQLVLAQPDRVRLLDVREPSELEICRIPGAAAIPMGEIPDRIADLSRDQHLLVFCHHGGRSLRVAQFLCAQGFTAVSNVTGGIDAWAEQLDPQMARY